MSVRRSRVRLRVCGRPGSRYTLTHSSGTCVGFLTVSASFLHQTLRCESPVRTVRPLYTQRTTRFPCDSKPRSSFEIPRLLDRPRRALRPSEMVTDKTLRPVPKRPVHPSSPDRGRVETTTERHTETRYRKENNSESKR